MRIVTVLFLVFFSSCFGQGKKTLISTLYFDNGQQEVMFEYDSLTSQYAGFYKTFDEKGVLLVNGNYQEVDSVQCKDCYDDAFIRYDYAQPGSIKIGVWSYYYSNGQLQSQGEYAKMVHAHNGTTNPDLKNGSSSGPINVWIRYDELKQGDWTYYDESGKKTKTETYLDGALIYTLTYE